MCLLLKSIEVRNINATIPYPWMIEYMHRPSNPMGLNTLRPRQNGRHFPDDIFRWIFLNENVWISIKISLKFVPRGPINYISTLVQVMAWRRPGDKPLSEPMMVRLPTHICVTRPQWVKHTMTQFRDLSRSCYKTLYRILKRHIENHLSEDLRMFSYQYTKLYHMNITTEPVCYINDVPSIL